MPSADEKNRRIRVGFFCCLQTEMWRDEGIPPYGIYTREPYSELQLRALGLAQEGAVEV